MAKAAKAYRVYFAKTDEHEDGEDYLVDHSIVIYLLAPNGEFLDFFTQRTTVSPARQMIESLARGLMFRRSLVLLRQVPSGVVVLGITSVGLSKGFTTRAMTGENKSVHKQAKSV